MAAPIVRACATSSEIYRLTSRLNCVLRQIPRAHYAKKIGGAKLAKGMLSAAPQKKHMSVEEDPHKLCKFLVGGNILKEGSDPELKPDSEYPEWLWTLRTDPGAVPLEELDKDTWAYWNRLKKEDNRRIKREQKTMYKYKRF